MTQFGELYRNHAPDVFRFALYLSGNRTEAEDITAETFVRAWTSPEPIRMATVKGYLFTIARNLFLNGRRKAARHVELTETLPDPGPAPDAAIERDSELARALGISLASVKVKIHRARLALARLRDREA